MKKNTQYFLELLSKNLRKKHKAQQISKFKMLTHVEYIKTVESMKKNEKNVKVGDNNGKTKF